MSSLNQVILARPYARALFELSKLDEGLVEFWKSALEILTLVSKNKEFKRLEQHPSFDAATWHSIINDTFDLDSFPLKEREIFFKYANLIFLNRRIYCSDQIYTQYLSLLFDYKAWVIAKVWIAHPIEKNEEELLSIFLSKKFSRKLILKFFHDPSLLGGIRVAVGDFVWNCSISGKLAQLQASLTK